MALTLQQEQTAFEAQLDELIATHAGEFVLFNDGRPVAFFKAHEAAYREGIERFGPDATFLVAQVKRSAPGNISLAWVAGVMFG